MLPAHQQEVAGRRAVGQITLLAADAEYFVAALMTPPENLIPRF